MSLVTPSSVEKLQRALQAKAKAEPEFRFYQLYDKLYREDVLTHAYRLCRSNRGAPGVDGIDFEQIESSGLMDWFDGLAWGTDAGTETENVPEQTGQTGVVA